MDDKIVIWGTGKLFQGMHKLINLENVLYLVDSDSNKEGKILYGKKIVKPAKIKEMQYDKVIIFVSRQFDEIYIQLTDILKVEKEKIQYWGHYYNFYNIQQSVEYLMIDLYNKGFETMLDIGCNLANNKVYVNDYIRNRDKGAIEVFGCEKGEKVTGQYPIYSNLYQKVYMDYKDAVTESSIDAVFLGNISNQEGFAQQIEYFLNIFNTVYFVMPYPDTKENRERENLLKGITGQVKEWKLNYDRLICMEKEHRQPMVKIFIAAHKMFHVPENQIYIPLWLGKSEDNILGFTEDKEKPEISHLNPLINECTGLYWMWKHVKDDFVGLVHYRRYFLNDENASIENILTQEQVVKILRKYDIIVAPLMYLPCSLYEQLQMTLEQEAFQTGYELVRDRIANVHPEYLDVFETVFSGNTFFPCNMFVTRKQMMDDYCDWLFQIIIDVSERIDVTNYAPYSKRVIGFIAERLFTVWLVCQNIRIKELPILVTEEISDENTDGTRRIPI